MALLELSAQKLEALKRALVLELGKRRQLRISILSTNTQNIEQNITQDNFPIHTEPVLSFPKFLMIHNPFYDWSKRRLCVSLSELLA
jgi:hypothetical protein